MVVPENERARLITIRGNSGSGKSTVARALPQVHGRGLAIISQDVVRREILKEKGRRDAVNITMIDLMARHALDHGFHTVVEGIMYTGHYGEMLTALLRDHRGASRAYYFDLPFSVTLERHATKPVAEEYGEAKLRDWWRPRDLLPGRVEEIIDEDSDVGTTVTRILHDCGLASDNKKESRSPAAPRGPLHRSRNTGAQ